MIRKRTSHLRVLLSEETYRSNHLILAELPKDRDIVAYCRGPFCLFSDEAQRLLTRKGYRVRKLLDGVAEWQAAGMAVERSPDV